MNWWSENNIRLIQNNISESNASLDVDLLIQKLREFSANTLMLNTGGIEAFYPTKLEYHFRSPYLEKDLIQEVIQKCHENNIKFIARFDFSKAHESIYAKQPSWFYKTADNQIINYNEMVHTCVNGYYQREYSLRIIEEVIDNYAVDGIFFNMFGYQTRDYSNHYYGICHCESCKNRFKTMFNHDLPSRENFNDPVYQDYIAFKDITTKEMLERIHDLVKRKNKNIAISTYHDYKVDIVRKESNTAIDRPYPKWLYSASENVQSIEDSWQDKLISNCVINAVDIFYRFVGVSKNEIKIRLYESMASGSGLDFCIIGVFDGYPDRDNFQVVKNIYAFHQKNQQYFGNFTSVADVLLIKPNHLSRSNSIKEYLGLYKMLKEQHIIFDVLLQENINVPVRSLDRYKLIIFPNVKGLRENEWNAIEEALTKGVSVIATGQSFTSNLSNQNKLTNVFGGRYQGIKQETRSDYLEVMDKKTFSSFQQRNWIFIDGEFTKIAFNTEITTLLPYIETSRFGPPERVGGHQKNGDFGMGWYNKDSHVSIYIPWEIGHLYYQHGFEDHKRIITDLIDCLLKGSEVLTTDAPENVEIFLNKYDERNYLLQLLNRSGFNGTTYHEANVIEKINVRIKGRAIKHVFSLVGKNAVSYEMHDDILKIKVDKLKNYEALILQI